MKVLFLTIGRMENIENKGIYTDLLRCFRKNGHQIYTISPYERREKKKTALTQENDVTMLHVKIGNITKCGLVEKGISTLLIEQQFISAIKKYFKNVKFDVVIYSTPPITFVNAVKFLKKRDHAKTYLLLKDIFPQNAVDIGMMPKSGPKAFLYHFFRWKEKKLYAISDKIGCMSQANVEYILSNNAEVRSEKIEVCANSIEVCDERLTPEQKTQFRQQYGIPTDKTVFIYGGNLGRPQDIPFVIECLKANACYDDRYFVICGNGTEYPKLKAYIDTEHPKNILLINGLPKNEYDRFVGCCDVGLIFLDHRFTIPNFPSRLLAYMQKGMPVLACTDRRTDIGEVITNGGFGWWCESVSTDRFVEKIDEALHADLGALGKNAFAYLVENYTVERSYETIMKFIRQESDYESIAD